MVNFDTVDSIHKIQYENGGQFDYCIKRLSGIDKTGRFLIRSNGEVSFNTLTAPLREDEKAVIDHIIKEVKNEL